ncbi:MAG TPA: cytochrome c3 family protein, partial [Pyrinomonadaceae bacterium]|nr:cytochrome c3 family protein [Pyrinomonadaceae bacterium]
MNRFIQALLICAFVVATIGWFGFDNSSQSAPFTAAELALYKSTSWDDKSADYVGSEACKDCHEDQFKAFSHTSHAQLGKIGSWKEKVTGCESCHGPGRAHIEEGDPKKIISFKNKPSKQISETCLGCHAGKEEHNNFRRGEHWRNDIGCADCHASHTLETGRQLATSNVFISSTNAQKPGIASVKLLKNSEPQLCLSCHSEVKHQFQLPFHHKVLEGALKCSDCHNPHGGFELKQTRLATGVDATCIKCHVDKQGPFVYEHAPVKTEG